MPLPGDPGFTGVTPSGFDALGAALPLGKSDLVFYVGGVEIARAPWNGASTGAFGGSPTFSVLDYGADRTGVTDSSTAIQAAITAAVAAGGGTVFFPPGTYLVNSRPLLKSGVTLQGAGWGASKIKAGPSITTSVVGAATVDAASSASILDLTIDGSSVATLNGIQIAAAVRCTIARCRIISCTVNGIRALNGTNNRVLQCRIESPGQEGIRLETETDAFVFGNYVYDTGSAGTNPHAIEATTNSVRPIISHNRIDIPNAYASMGIRLNTCTDPQVIGNHITSNIGNLEAIDVVSGCLRAIVSVNRVDTTGDNGITIAGVDCTCTGNLVSNAKYSGINSLANNSVIVGNICKNNGQGALAANQCGIILDGATTGAVVVGNRCFDDQGSPTQLYGLQLRSSTGSNYIGPNSFVGNATGEFNNASSGTGNLVNYSFGRKATPTYSASITPDALGGNWQTITVTTAAAFTINAPTNPPDAGASRQLVIEIFNNSGGAMGAITWNAAFKLVGGAFTNPATGNKRYLRFEWNGSAWVETNRAAADYT